MWLYLIVVLYADYWLPKLFKYCRIQIMENNCKISCKFWWCGDTSYMFFSHWNIHSNFLHHFFSFSLFFFGNLWKKKEKKEKKEKKKVIQNIKRKKEFWWRTICFMGFLQWKLRTVQFFNSVVVVVIKMNQIFLHQN